MLGVKGAKASHMLQAAMASADTATAQVIFIFYKFEVWMSGIDSMIICRLLLEWKSTRSIFYESKPKCVKCQLKLGSVKSKTSYYIILSSLSVSRASYCWLLYYYSTQNHHALRNLEDIAFTVDGSFYIQYLYLFYTSTTVLVLLSLCPPWLDGRWCT